jgi:hypothetical protein
MLGILVEHVTRMVSVDRKYAEILRFSTPHGVTS